MATSTLPWLRPADPTPTLPGPFWKNIRRMRTDPIGMFSEARDMGADVVRLRAGPINAYALYSPDAVQRVLVAGAETTAKGTRGSRLLRRVLGEGLLTSEGDAWKARRRRSQPHFRRDAFADLPAVVERHTIAQTDGWNGTTEVSAVTGRRARGVGCEVLVGAPLDDRDAHEVGEALERILAGFLWMITFPIEGVDRWPLPASRRHRAAVDALGGVVDRLVARERARPGGPAGGLLRDWIAATDRGEMSAPDLRSEVVTMLLAGHETTAHAMAWTLGLLAQHPEIQESIRRDLANGDLASLDRAVAESLRLYPPAWIVARTCHDAMDLGSVTVPAGAFLFMPIAAWHRNPRLWVDADAFVPDRWIALDPSAKAVYMPFGAGQRKCIGEHFARTEARVALGAMLRRYRFAPVAGRPMRAEASVTLRPAAGIWLEITPSGV